jgi:DNA-binding NtrC family response regulator
MHDADPRAAVPAPAILFVDDEPHILTALKRTLADEPYEVHTSTDPEEALQLVETLRPAVVVSDFYMPGMQGPELLGRVREIDPAVIRMILTGKPDLMTVLASVQDGSIFRFLIKPWDVDELRMGLRTALSHQKVLAERNVLLRAMQREERRERMAEVRQAAKEDLSDLLGGKHE